MPETALPAQKMTYNIAADNKPSQMAFALIFRCCFNSGCSQNDRTANPAAENEILIQNTDQLR